MEQLDITRAEAATLTEANLIYNPDPDNLAYFTTAPGVTLDEGRPPPEPKGVSMDAKCPECGRVFDLTDEGDANEFHYGHDCEAPAERSSIDSLDDTFWAGAPSPGGSLRTPPRTSRKDQLTMAEIRDDRNGNYIAEHYPASQVAVDALLASPVGDDGRSEWTWLRLANGDLMLGIFPTGEMYFELELVIEADYKAAEAPKEGS